MHAYQTDKHVAPSAVAVSPLVQHTDTETKWQCFFILCLCVCVCVRKDTTLVSVKQAPRRVIYVLDALLKVVIPAPMQVKTILQNIDDLGSILLKRALKKPAS